MTQFRTISEGPYNAVDGVFQYSTMHTLITVSKPTTTTHTTRYTHVWQEIEWALVPVTVYQKEKQEKRNKKIIGEVKAINQVLFSANQIDQRDFPNLIPRKIK